MDGWMEREKGRERGEKGGRRLTRRGKDGEHRKTSNMDRKKARYKKKGRKEKLQRTLVEASACALTNMYTHTPSCSSRSSPALL